MFARPKSLAYLCLFLAGCFSLAAPLAGASASHPIQLKVLSSEYRSLEAATPVPRNCDLQNFDAYCNDSKNPMVQNVMVVEDPKGKSFKIGCTVDSRWSRCAPLKAGDTVEAREEKHGFTLYFENAKGKLSKATYVVLANAPEGSQLPPAPAEPATQSAAPSRPAAEVPAHSSSAMSPPVAAQPAANAVKTIFGSTPAGAEITLDGKYVGNTPSEIAVTPGTHVVVFTLPGFAQWKRDLTVEAGSESVNVSANLQKAQP